MTKNTRKNAAKKAARTMKNRREFVAQFGVETFNALRNIVAGTTFHTTDRRRSLAAYKANLTRGTYRDWVRTNESGAVVVDKIGVTRV